MPDQSLPVDDLILPFQIDSSNLRGRVVRLGPELDKILQQHDYPKPVSHLVAESIALSLALSSMLKYEGIFTLQAQGDGPVPMIVSDVRSPAYVRGCAHFDEERVEQARQQLGAMATPEAGQNHLAQFLGKGHLAFTVDGNNQERYQGIVDLQGASLIDCVQNYFEQSEQIGTGIHMAVGQRNGQWRACIIMLQHMPEDDVNRAHGSGNLEEDDWRRAMILMQSATEDELLSKDLKITDLLIRLFHEDGVRIFDHHDIHHECRCSLEKVQNVLKVLPEDDRDYMIKDGHIEMKCEFCSKIYLLDPQTLAPVNEEL